MKPVPFLFDLFITITTSYSVVVHAVGGGEGYPSLRYPNVIASNIPFSVDLYFPPLFSSNATSDTSGTSFVPWPANVRYKLTTSDSVIREGLLQPYEDSLGLPGIITGDYNGKIGKVTLNNLVLPIMTYGNIDLMVELFLPENSPSSNFTKTSQRFADTGSSFSSIPFFKDKQTVFVFPAILSIFPSLVTVTIAIVLKQNLLALFIGAWLGSTFYYQYNPIIGLLRLLDTIVISAMADSEHAAVMYFCLLIGGMIAVIGKGGGAIGMATVVTRWATTRLKGQVATYLIGVCTFFDDYASCLVAGSTTRDFLARQQTSREKSSFIVDTNAAAIPSLFPFSSWIGVEVSFIADQLLTIGMDPSLAYDVFMQTIPYRFYPLLILTFSLTCILTQRDFGPMLRAERRAIQTGLLIAEGGQPMSASQGEEADLAPKGDQPQRWYNAIIPFVVVILAIVCGMLFDGYSKTALMESQLNSALSLARSNNNAAYIGFLEGKLRGLGYNIRDLFSAGSPYSGLLWASFLGSAAAILLVVCQKILTLGEAMDAWLAGTKSMLFALLILIHAWALVNIFFQLCNTVLFFNLISFCRELYVSNYKRVLL